MFAFVRRGLCCCSKSMKTNKRCWVGVSMRNATPPFGCNANSTTLLLRGAIVAPTVGVWGLTSAERVKDCINRNAYAIFLFCFHSYAPIIRRLATLHTAAKDILTQRCHMCAYCAVLSSNGIACTTMLTDKHSLLTWLRTQFRLNSWEFRRSSVSPNHTNWWALLSGNSRRYI